MCAQSLQLCPILCDPLDRSPPGSSVLGIFQARIMEWAAMLSSRGSSCPRDQTASLLPPALAGGFFIARNTYSLPPLPWTQHPSPAQSLASLYLPSEIISSGSRPQKVKWHTEVTQLDGCSQDPKDPPVLVLSLGTHFDPPSLPAAPPGALSQVLRGKRIGLQGGQDHCAAPPSG